MLNAILYENYNNYKYVDYYHHIININSTSSFDDYDWSRERDRVEKGDFIKDLLQISF